MFRTALGCLVAVAALSASANAADVLYTPVPRAHVASQVVVDVPPEADIIAVDRRLDPPNIAFGCQRVWRCDSVVCEWRRGCWGVYGYVEGPYYTKELAERQWESHGWPTPARRRHRAAR